MSANPRDRTPGPRPRTPDPVDPREHAGCIGIRFLAGAIKTPSVPKYEDDLRRARSLSNVRALSFHELLWTVDAPAVHELTRDWQKPKSEAFRIYDWDVYAWQMDRLLGLR